MKGSSQTLWIVMAAVLAITMLLLLTTLSGKIIGKTGEQATSNVDISGTTVSKELCYSYCDSCSRIGKCKVIEGCETHLDIDSNGGCTKK